MGCRIKDAPGGFSISTVQDVDVEDRPDDEQYGHNAKHALKIAERAYIYVTLGRST